MQRDILWVGNTNTVTVRKLRSIVNDEFMQAAEVTATVVDEDGEPVTGETWPKSMARVPTIDGGYRVTLSQNLNIEDGQQVTLIVQAVESLSTARWEKPMLCLRRANDGIG